MLYKMLKNIRTLFVNAPRIGNDKDDPEGTRYIQISETLIDIYIEQINNIIKGGIKYGKDQSKKLLNDPLWKSDNQGEYHLGDLMYNIQTRKTEVEIMEKEENLHNRKIGDVVKFVDSGGKEHNALVIHTWVSSLNIVYIRLDKDGNDSYGNQRMYETSVPFYEHIMSGFYINEPMIPKI